MYTVNKNLNKRRNNRSGNQDFFKRDMQIFQKTPITILEELFPSCTNYTWSVARNYGCADLFKCRVQIANCSGESISFSKKIAKHQAALEALINVQKYTGNRDLENFIRSYVCGGASIMCLKSIFPGQEKVDFQYEGIEGRRRSRSRARSCSRSRGRSRSRAKSSSRCGNEGQRRSRSCSRARGRSPFRGSDKFGGSCRMPCAPMGETNAVKCLEEECKLSGIPAPEYSPHFRGRTGELVVVAKLGPFTSKGTGKTRESAKQAAAAALIDSFFDDN